MTLDKDTSLRFLGSFLGVLTISLIFGLVFWSVQLRLMRVTDLDTKTKMFVVVKLTDVEKDSEVVFQYPHVESPMHLGHIKGFKAKKGFLLDTKQEMHLPRELIVGTVLYKF